MQDKQALSKQVSADVASDQGQGQVLTLTAQLEEARRARRLAEELLRETYTAMIKHQQVSKSGDFRYDTTTGASRGTRETYRMFGFPEDTVEVPQEKWTSTIHPEDKTRIINQLNDAIAARGPMRFEYRILLEDGTMKFIRCDGEPDLEFEGVLTYYGVLSDVTDRKQIEESQRRMESELAAALRLASMGELAGSIIHEINQPLAAISASADACRRWIDAGPERTDRALASLDRVVEESRRAAAVVAGLKSLTRNVAPAIAPLELNEAVREVCTLMLGELAREKVLLETEFETELPHATGDRVQVQQIVMNLARNSIEAMRSSKRRRLLISTRKSEEGVRLTVSDTGPGIDPEHASRLFEPLYTTKEDGMGLGLSISRKIAGTYGGKLWAEPGKSAGATFHLTLPSVQD